MLEIGIKGQQDLMVTEENSALSLGSGLLEVFATPAMIALMEKTAWKSVAPYLNDSEGTVGTLMNVSHIAATPIGMQVRCESELIQVDGRKLVFHVAAFDQQGKIGEGQHERIVINNAKFMEKVLKKLDS